MTMEKIAFRMFLNPGQTAEYRRRHDAIWPELVAVLIIESLSPTDTIALARTRTLIGRGIPLSSTSAVWSVMSRSTLITLLEMVVPVVSRGISFDLPGPR